MEPVQSHSSSESFTWSTASNSSKACLKVTTLSVSHSRPLCSPFGDTLSMICGFSRLLWLNGKLTDAVRYHRDAVAIIRGLCRIFREVVGGGELTRTIFVSEWSARLCLYETPVSFMIIVKWTPRGSAYNSICRTGKFFHQLRSHKSPIRTWW